MIHAVFLSVRFSGWSSEISRVCCWRSSCSSFVGWVKRSVTHRNRWWVTLRFTHPTIWDLRGCFQRQVFLLVFGDFSRVLLLAFELFQHEGDVAAEVVELLHVGQRYGDFR